MAVSFIEASSDCRVELREAVHYISLLLLEVGNMRHGRPGYNMAFQRENPIRHQAPHVMRHRKPTAQLGFPQASVVVVPTPVIETEI